MAKSYLVVRDKSLPYIGNIVKFITETSRSIFYDCEIVITSAVDSMDYEDRSIVMVIGEGFPDFKTNKKCKYFYFNFSVVCLLGNIFMNSYSGINQIRNKYDLLKRKLHSFDAIFDYYPPQTRKLSKTLPVNVFSFLPASIPSTFPHNLPMNEREFDVCFVGGMTTRRTAVANHLMAAGLKLSPSSGEDIESIAVKSRCTLNVHLQRSNHLEIPRVMGALMAGSPVVSEKSYQMTEIFPEALALECTYSNIIESTINMLSDIEKLKDLSEKSFSWYRKVYFPYAQQLLRSNLIAARILET